MSLTDEALLGIGDWPDHLNEHGDWVYRPETVMAWRLLDLRTRILKDQQAADAMEYVIEAAIRERHRKERDGAE